MSHSKGGGRQSIEKNRTSMTKIRPWRAINMWSIGLYNAGFIFSVVSAICSLWKPIYKVSFLA